MKTDVANPDTLPSALRVFLRHGSPRILVALTLIASAARVAVGGASLEDALVVLAILFVWPVLEWCIHVFILHFRPRRLFGRTIDLAVAIKHRAHHADPNALEEAFVPLHVYLIVPPILGAFLLLAPDPPWVLTGVVTYLVLSLQYEWLHYLIHTRYRPRSAWYERLWRNHRLHHFKNEEYWMGVTMLSGDRLLGTAPDHRTVETSKTCRTLGI
jgi:hypothetical protein